MHSFSFGGKKANTPLVPFVKEDSGITETQRLLAKADAVWLGEEGSIDSFLIAEIKKRETHQK